MFKYIYGNKYCENEEISKCDSDDKDMLCACLDFLDTQIRDYDPLPDDWNDTIFYKKEEI